MAFRLVLSGVAAALLASGGTLAHAQASAPHARTTADILRDAPASAWRHPDPTTCWP